MSEKITIRPAVAGDAEFILRGIIAAEKSGTDLLPYTGIFGLSEDETAEMISDILDEEIEGQEWYLPNFRILEKDGNRAACLSAWTEGECGMPSGHLKAQAMSWILRDKWTAAAANLELLKEMQLPRLQGALQLECIYTSPEFRGQGLAGKLIDSVTDEYRITGKELSKAEIQLLGHNETAIRSYTKCGFLKRETATCADPRILTLLPHNTRISLVKEI